MMQMKKSSLLVVPCRGGAVRWWYPGVVVPTSLSILTSGFGLCEELCGCGEGGLWCLSRSSGALGWWCGGAQHLYQYLPVGLGWVKSGVGVGRVGCGVCPGLVVPWGGGAVGCGVCINTYQWVWAV